MLLKSLPRLFQRRRARLQSFFHDQNRGGRAGSNRFHESLMCVFGFSQRRNVLPQQAFRDSASQRCHV